MAWKNTKCSKNGFCTVKSLNSISMFCALIAFNKSSTYVNKRWTTLIAGARIVNDCEWHVYFSNDELKLKKIQILINFNGCWDQIFFSFLITKLEFSVFRHLNHQNSHWNLILKNYTNPRMKILSDMQHVWEIQCSKSI